MDKQLLAKLISRYKSGQATADEKFLLEAFWIDAQKNNSVLDGLSDDQLDVLQNGIFAKIQQRIGSFDLPEKNHVIPRWSYPIAASVIFLITTFTLTFWYVNKPIEVRTGYGERRVVTFPDHSSVTLNGNTLLRYTRSWDDDKTREVWIDGEGFFSVKHTSNHQKFLVHASNQLNVEVLGTKFNVKSRALKSEVMLTEGKVKLEMQDSKNPSVFLKPGELAVLSNKKLSKREVKNHQYTSWLNYTLLFDRTTLRDVAALLEDTYGLHVVFTDTTLQDRELSGEISSSDVSDILTAISQIFNLKVERKNQTVIISANEEVNN